MTETQRRFLRRLRGEQPKGLRQSDIPKTCKALVTSLQNCGAADFRPSDSGRGIVLRIVETLAFDRFVSAHCPQGLDVELESIQDRATAIYLLADAKAFRRSIGEGIFVRSTKPGVELLTTDGAEPVPVTELTRQAGGTGIQLSPAKTWIFHGAIAVVENADAFWQHEAVLPDIDLAVFASGCMSTRLLDWLSSPQMRSCHITHWGDYDPVGVCEYLRLAAACVGRIQAFAPAEVDQLLPRYGKKTLVTRQIRYLTKLRAVLDDAHVCRMVDLFDKHRRGLEQELLLKTAPEDC